MVFDETWRDSLPSSPGLPIPEDDDYDDDYEIVCPPEPQAPTAKSSDVQEDNPDVPTRVVQFEMERLDRIDDNPRSRSEREHASRSFALNSEDESSAEVILLAVTKPPSYRRAMKCPETLLWSKTVESEYISLTANNTWDLVPYLGTMKVIGCRCKIKLKRDATGNIKKYKARLVARCDHQEPDWNSVFAPTVQYTSLRVILAIACINDWKIEQKDVVSAFLNDDVESEIYMDQPEG